MGCSDPERVARTWRRIFVPAPVEGLLVDICIRDPLVSRRRSPRSERNCRDGKSEPAGGLDRARSSGRGHFSGSGSGGETGQEWSLKEQQELMRFCASGSKIACRGSSSAALRLLTERSAADSETSRSLLKEEC